MPIEHRVREALDATVERLLGAARKIDVEEVELLARHAAVCLENITSVRPVEVLARPN